MWNVIPGALIFIIVVIKFIAPNIEEIPDKCNENIAKSTEPPLCDWIEDNGGYTVQPVPAPFSTNADDNNNINEGGNNQNDILFSRGNQLTFVISYKFGLCLYPI